MPSNAQNFKDDFEALKEFVDDQGRHFYVIQFEDGSGLVFRKKQSEDEESIAEFVIRHRGAKEAMRMINSATDFGFDEDKNTQQNIQELMRQQ